MRDLGTLIIEFIHDRDYSNKELLEMYPQYAHLHLFILHRDGEFVAQFYEPVKDRPIAFKWYVGMEVTHFRRYPNYAPAKRDHGKAFWLDQDQIAEIFGPDPSPYAPAALARMEAMFR